MAKQAKSRGNRIAYIDLFAGPGSYGDGAKSTPILVLERAVDDAKLREMLVAKFNDADPNNAHLLRKAIEAIPNIDRLKYPPVVYSEQVGQGFVEKFEHIQLIPALLFVDPWGYKGLTLRLISSVLKDFGCDCIFFFNYNRINMGLPNEAVEDHMNALFGEERADSLRVQLKPMTPDERELTIIEAISQALKEINGEFVLPFRFKNAQGTRTSHYLIFVSKHVLGYKIMKDIMAKQSSSAPQGVPSFEYSPATREQPLLFELSRPLDDLADMLLDEFAGRRMTVDGIFNQHHVGRPFVKANYKDVLVSLEEQGNVLINPPADQRPRRKGKVTLKDEATVAFPARTRPS
jgi:three-Cys-motif partner protein